ncbi:hypothetical protein RRF57_006629 [Xylaria bambusicola]|uniref:Uncharacterized protein n=1 Tax=Xylaria bambusicola TaxID=326684 RepID=A0AAN7UJM0_9PEZI
MASRAGARAAARTLHFQVIRLRNIQQVIARRYSNPVLFLFLVDERHVQPRSNSSARCIDCNAEEAKSYSSPGFGGVMCPCRCIWDVLKGRRAELEKTAQLRGEFIILRLVDFIEKLRGDEVNVGLAGRLRKLRARILEVDIS